MKTDLSALEQVIGYRFRDRKLLQHALRHSSYTNEKSLPYRENNERLEFLGDAVLELISSEFLFSRSPMEHEGTLTRKRASMVCETSLAYCARRLGLGDFLLLGKGEDHCGGRNRDSIISDALEALIGAIYLDGGFEAARTFIMGFVLNDLNERSLFVDSKTILQEMVQAGPFNEFHYEQTGESGPDHDKVFTVQAVLDGEVIGTGTGRSKKTAEQAAAFEAIRKLRS